MLDFIPELLYGISKSIFRLIDGLMSCANMLCGIEPISYKGEDTNFLTFLFADDRVQLAFRVAALMGLILVVFFAIFAIVRSVISEKNNMSPLRIVMDSSKTVLLFLFIPAVMILMVHFADMFVKALYSATLGGSTDGIGRFLCGAFSQDALLPETDPNFYTSSHFDYTDTDALWGYIDLWDFDFFFSWVAGFCILVTLAQTLLMFVDRAISLVLLFIVSPLSLSTHALDDGAHFKLWRDQVLVKFLTGYGCILGINIYILIVAIISSDDVVFFQSSDFLNNLMKIAFFLGGAVSMQRVMALVGNLVSAGAGSNELRDNAIANQGFKSAAGSFVKGVTSPLRFGRWATNKVNDVKQHGFKTTLGDMLGFKTNKDYGIRTKGAMKQEKELQENKTNLESAARERTNDNLATMIGSRVADAISGKNPGGGGGDNAAGDKKDGNKNNALNNIINNQQNDKK